MEYKRSEVEVCIETSQSPAERRREQRVEARARGGEAGERELMIPKQRTAFVFIWCDGPHALLLVAVRGGGVVRKEREAAMERGGEGGSELWFFSNGR